MTLYYNARQKIINIIRTIDALLDREFPVNSGIDALVRLKKAFQDIDGRIIKADKLNDEAAKRQNIQILNTKIFQSLPILGFIIRSTNIRNAFELLEPLQQIADSILQGRPKLLLSSEWEYVPFAYPQSLEYLKSFILIGMPASEAASALLVPLTGHELGHAVWRNRGIGGGVHAALQKRCKEIYDADMIEFKKHNPKYSPTDIEFRDILPSSISLSVKISVFQAEEIFCDLFSYSIFGESYLESFSYILAPGSGRIPGSYYPTHEDRISTIISIAEREGIKMPSFDKLGFLPDKSKPYPQDRFALRVAETSVKEIIFDLWDTVDSLISNGGITRPDPTKCMKHLENFRIGIPANDPDCIGDIVNSGWLRYKEIIENYKSEKEFNNNMEKLNEMMLKSIEVLEYRHRTQ